MCRCILSFFYYYKSHNFTLNKLEQKCFFSWDLSPLSIQKTPEHFRKNSLYRCVNATQMASFIAYSIISKCRLSLHSWNKHLFEWLKVCLPSTCCLSLPACPLPAACPFLSLSVPYPLSVSLFVHLCLDSMLSFSSRLISFRLTSNLSFTLSFSHTLTLSDTHKLPHALSHSHTRGHSCRRWVDRCWNIGAI